MFIAGLAFSSKPTMVLPRATNLFPEGGFVAKLCPCGNIMWVKSVGTNAGYLGVTTDAAGNVYAAGYTNRLRSNWLLTKYDPQGNVLWTFKSQGQRVDDACQVSVDASNNVYITGFFSSTNILVGATILTNSFLAGHHAEQCLAKFDAAGKPIWTKVLYGVSGESRYIKPGFDRAGNVILASTFDTPLNFGGTNLPNTGPNDLFIAKFKPDGNVLWIKDVGTRNLNPYDSSQTFSTVDAFGNIFFGGSGWNANDAKLTFGDRTLTNQTGFIAKYDSDGNPLWAKGAPYGFSVFADAEGSVYQLGSSDNSGQLQFSGFKLTCPVNHLAYLAKYDPFGTLLWVTRLYGMEQNSLKMEAVSADRWGSIYFGGRFSGATMFGGLSLSSRYKGEGFLAKLEVSH